MTETIVWKGAGGYNPAVGTVRRGSEHQVTESRAARMAAKGRAAIKQDKPPPAGMEKSAAKAEEE